MIVYGFAVTLAVLFCLGAWFATSDNSVTSTRGGWAAILSATALWWLFTAAIVVSVVTS